MSVLHPSITLTNYKSIHNLTLSECRNINLIIGAAGTGKTNILNAIGQTVPKSFRCECVCDLHGTMARLDYYRNCIYSNPDTVILMGEPESHCAIPLIPKIVHEVLMSTSNQFFITTHSPYIYGGFLENFMHAYLCRGRLAVYTTGLRDGQTVVRRLTSDELVDMYRHGIDPFTNYEPYAPQLD